MSQSAGTPRPPPPPGPPPPKKLAVSNTTTSDNNTNNNNDKYAKYKVMMDTKISDSDIKEAMENDGFTQRDINRFFEQLFCQFADFSTLSSSLAEMKIESKVESKVATPVTGSQAGECAAKYSQMRVMGVSDAAVRSEMIEDKMPQEFIDGFFHNSLPPSHSVKSSKSASDSHKSNPLSTKIAEAQTPTSTLSTKTAKMPRPRPPSSGFSNSPGIGFQSNTGSSRNINNNSNNNNQDEFVELNPMRSLSQRGADQASASVSSRASAPVFARVPSGSLRMAPLYSSAPHSSTVSASSNKGVPNVVSEMEVCIRNIYIYVALFVFIFLMTLYY